MATHRAASNPARGPGGLKIKAAGEAIHVEQFAGEVEAGTEPAFHGLEIHLAQPHATASDELVFVQALAGDAKFSARELLNELVLTRTRKRSPARVTRDARCQHKFFP